MTSLGRFEEIPVKKLSPEQAAVSEAFVNRRGTVPAPFRIFLSSAPLAARLMALSDHILRGGQLSAAEVEIAVLAAARKLESKFVQAAHRKIAANAGLPPAVIEAILVGTDPGFSDARQRAVFRCATAMLNARQDDATFGEVASVLGHNGIVEVAAILGFYGTCAYTLGFYEVPPPVSAS
ncbi:carboxymuconolactone decarboxylase family protein [Bradyrhizobium sp.]|uniref:carboxymuconolactone decarboxylase family protein n=1 Tax=Bradyrhizobium sp. TaxID=376 RepID=UPI0039E2842F